MRFRVASRYIACISRNAALFHGIGRSAAKSTSADIALAGRELAEAALRVRLLSLPARLSLAVQIIFPRPFGTLSLLMRYYRRINAGVSHLSDLESSNPTVLHYL
jgi:hypothetical protein